MGYILYIDSAAKSMDGLPDLTAGIKGDDCPLCSRLSVSGTRHLNKNYKAWMLAQSGDLIQAVDHYARNTCGEKISHLFLQQ